MGDRGNIVIREDFPKENPGEVFLYTHWGGWELPETLRRGLERGRGRWTDSTYLARIIFCEMVKGHEDGETGFGIGTYPSDNEYPYLVVDVGSQQVVVREPRGDRQLQAVPFVTYVEGRWGWAEASDSGIVQQREPSRL